MADLEYELCTYLLIDILASLDTNDLGSSFMHMGYLRVVNKFLFHNWLEFHMCGLVNSLWEGLGGWSKCRLTIGLTKNILTFNTWNVSSISWNLFPWTPWLLKILSHIKFWWFVACVTWNGVLVIWNEHLIKNTLYYKLLLFYLYDICIK